MIIKLKNHASLAEVDTLSQDLLDQGFSFETVQGDAHTVMHVLGDTTTFDEKKLYAYDCVDRVFSLQDPFVRTHKDRTKTKTTIRLGSITVGRDLFVIGGPCSVESESQIHKSARLVKEAGAHALRGGAYKPRTSPYAFQGLGEKGLRWLSEAAKAHGLISVSEIVDKADLALFDKHVDVIQVGARNMQNFDLLKALGNSAKPILLKRGFGNTVEEWLMSAEYVMNHGNDQIMLCERGIRTFEPHTRATLDLSSVLAIRELSHLPVIVDPSHAAGKYAYVDGLAKAALAVGADGLMIEVHPNPVRAFSDGAQSLKPEKFSRLMDALRALDDTLKKNA